MTHATLRQLRRTPVHLCPLELRKIHSSVNHAVGGFELVPRYRRLETFYRRHRLEAEANWVAARAAALDGLGPLQVACPAGNAAQERGPNLQNGKSTGSRSAKHARPMPEGAANARQEKKGKTKDTGATNRPPPDAAKENGGYCHTTTASAAVDLTGQVSAAVDLTSPPTTGAVELVASSDDEDYMRPLAERLQARAQNR